MNLPSTRRNTSAKNPISFRQVLVLVLITHALNKFFVRPWVLDGEFPYFMVILVYSFPNFVEAIAGTVLLTGIAAELRRRFQHKLGGFRDSTLYLASSIAAGGYVITQELKLHNLGGNNVYDPYDLLASIIGLILINRLISKYGFKI